jgi:hypothetical protein
MKIPFTKPSKQKSLPSEKDRREERSYSVFNNTVARTRKGAHNSDGFPAREVLERMQSTYPGFSDRASSS